MDARKKVQQWKIIRKNFFKKFADERHEEAARRMQTHTHKSHKKNIKERRGIEGMKHEPSLGLSLGGQERNAQIPPSQNISNIYLPSTLSREAPPPPALPPRHEAACFGPSPENLANMPQGSHGRAK